MRVVEHRYRDCLRCLARVEGERVARVRVVSPALAVPSAVPYLTVTVAGSARLSVTAKSSTVPESSSTSPRRPPRAWPGRQSSPAARSRASAHRMCRSRACPRGLSWRAAQASHRRSPRARFEVPSPRSVRSSGPGRYSARMPIASRSGGPSTTASILASACGSN